MKNLVLFLCLTSGLLFSDNWKKIKVEGNYTIHKMTYSGDQLWGVSYGGGHILKSDDEGNTWKKTASLKANYLEKIQFTNSKNGFVCGDYGYVYKSTDGGKNWTEISPKIENRITTVFDQENEKPDGEFISFYDMYFGNAQNGYVIGFSYKPSVGRQSSTKMLYYATKDGGNSWQKIDRNTLKSLQKDFFSKVDRNKISLGGLYYLTPHDIYQVRSQKGKKIVLKSDNGGVNWKQHILNDQDVGKWMVRDIVFTNESTGYIFGGLISVKNPKAVIFSTVDGGASWHLYENNWPSVHHALIKNESLFVSVKEGELMIMN